MDNINHTFVVCAYKESTYLEECLISLVSQIKKSKIIISTSTPNDHIRGLAEKYNIPLYINEGEAGITGDWNFATTLVDTKYLTIAHQDDVYEPTYSEEIIAKLEKAKNPIIAFSEYFEIRNGERVYKNKLLRVKRVLNFGFRFFKKSRFVRRRSLSLGCCICCPSVTYATAVFSSFKFDKSFKFVCDWDAWERLSKMKGEFIYLKKPLMGHRIHEESETTNLTNNGRRALEELTMLKRFWPKFIAKSITIPYSKAKDSNELKERE